ncbi:hypothetical protein [Paraburkholderia phenoliruptrix]|nr:hypothetical protein [Paraburkholderia phenoliruptrix]MDR6389179.1 hypothetical protein [Paraburkholderia phenoliruptrix]
MSAEAVSLFELQRLSKVAGGSLIAHLLLCIAADLIAEGVNREH